MSEIKLPKRKLAPLIRMSDVVGREMTWLWYPYIPAESATLFFGPGGIGKSHLTAAIATIISRGDPFPGEETRRKPGKVLMLSAEDDLDVVLQPRLSKLGADMSNIMVSPNTFILDAQGLRDVEEYIRQSTAVIVFIDPIVAWTGSKVDMNRSNDVRAMIGPIHTMAQKTGAAIVIVGHSRKGGEGEDYEKAMGSSDFVNAVRSVVSVTRTNDGTKVIKHVKANYSALGATRAFYFNEDGFQWGDEFENDGTKAHSTGKPRAVAVAFIKTILATGPVPAKEIEALAKDEGIAPATLGRAKAGVADSFLERQDGKLVWYWKLIGDKRNASGKAAISGLEAGAKVEVQSGQGGSRDAVEHASGQGDSGADGPLDRGGEATSGEAAETSEEHLRRHTIEARARARRFLEDRGLA